MPYFNGAAIFGICKMATGSVERERQINGFFGLQGSESIDGGYRHRITTVNGIHVCDSLGSLVYLQEIFRSYEDQNAYVLIDTRGVTWANVMLLGFNPTDQIRATPRGGALQTYTATFHHLSPS